MIQSGESEDGEEGSVGSVAPGGLILVLRRRSRGRAASSHSSENFFSVLGSAPWK